MMIHPMIQSLLTIMTKVAMMAESGMSNAMSVDKMEM